MSLYDPDAKIDIPLLRKGVEWVEDEATKPWSDRVWHQDYWIMSAETAHPSDSELKRGEAERGQTKNFCGTCYCFAGNIAAWDGFRVYDAFERAKNPETGETVDPDTYATERLGLTYEQAEALFDGDNSAEDIRRIAEEIAGQRL